jgi:hypothetical protein
MKTVQEYMNDPRILNDPNTGEALALSASCKYKPL